MFFNLNIFSHDFFVYLLVLLLSPIIFLIIVTVPKFIFSVFFKKGRSIKGNKLLEQKPEISIVEKNINGKIEKEILVKNFRNAKYLSNEFDNVVNWESKKFKLDQLENIELFTDKYAPFQSHAILIFNFIDEYKVCKKMCVSYEIKHEANDIYYPYKAIYNNYESGYIVGSFEDLVGVRYLRKNNFNHKHAVLNLKKPDDKNLKFSKLNFTKTEVEKIFQSLLEDINKYSKNKYLYNFIYRNCLTEILKHFKISKRFNFSYIELLFLNKVLLKNRILLEK